MIAGPISFDTGMFFCTWLEFGKLDGRERLQWNVSWFPSKCSSEISPFLGIYFSLVKLTWKIEVHTVLKGIITLMVAINIKAILLYKSINSYVYPPGEQYSEAKIHASQ